MARWNSVIIPWNLLFQRYYKYVGYFNGNDNNVKVNEKNWFKLLLTKYSSAVKS